MPFEKSCGSGKIQCRAIFIPESSTKISLIEDTAASIAQDGAALIKKEILKARGSSSSGPKAGSSSSNFCPGTGVT